MSELLEKLVSEFAKRNKTGSGLVFVKDAVRGERLSFVDTGSPGLNRVLGGSSGIPCGRILDM